MAGLIVWAIFGLWVWFVVKTSKAIGTRITPGRWRRPVTVLLFLMLLPLPVLDEIIGGFQFRALCEKNAKLKFNVDPATLKGKTIRSIADPLNRDVEGTLVRIYYSHFSYRDVESDKELLNYTEYYAKGGLLVRTLSFDSNITPMTFTFTCSPLPQTDFGFKFAKINDTK